LEKAGRLQRVAMQSGPLPTRTGDFAKAVEWQRKATADPRLKGNDGALQRLRL